MKNVRLSLAGVFCAFALVCGAMFCFTTQAQAQTIPYEYDGVKYEYKDGKISVTGCNSGIRDVYIRSEIAKHPVSEIAAGAFTRNRDINSVNIQGEKLKKIGATAFKRCENLRSINFPKSLTTIEENAFANCNSLEVAQLPAGVEDIPTCCFSECYSLREVSTYANAIGAEAFVECTSLSQVTFYVAENNLQDEDDEEELAEEEGGDAPSVGSMAFYGCTALTKVKLPSGVSEVGNMAFAGGKNKTVYMPDSVKEIAINAFDGNEWFVIRCHEGSAADLIAKSRGWKIEYVRLLQNASLSGAGEAVYNGRAQQPNVAVWIGGTTLARGVDYNVTYSNNVAIGKATVTVSTCSELYEGSKSCSFTIRPATPSLKKLTKGKKQFKATWGKTLGAGGYKIRYATSKAKVATAKQVTVSASSAKKTFKKLKKKKRYYVQIRAYKDVEIDPDDPEYEDYDDDTIRYYSPWSTIKSVKTK